MQLYMYMFKIIEQMGIEWSVIKKKETISNAY